MGRAIVPAAFRDDWSREWHAELYYGAEALGSGAEETVDLLKRCVGALVQAVWLRKEEWSFTVIFQDVRYAMRGLSHRAWLGDIAHRHAGRSASAPTPPCSASCAPCCSEPLPFHEPARLVQIWETNPCFGTGRHSTLSPANLIDIRS